MNRRILVVEDEPSILDNILYSLETEGFDTTGCPTGQEALEHLHSSEFALMILDIGLPDMNGFELCQVCRRQSNIPIIFLTARTAEVDRIVGLEIGADDYVLKPFSPRELSARVRAILRRSQPEAAPTSAGSYASHAEQPQTKVPLRIDEDRAEIIYFGQKLPLSSTEFRLLRVFCQHPGRVYSRTQLMDIAWPEPEAAMERTVDAHVKSLRAKLRRIRSDIDPIITHRGLGYALKEDW